MSEIDWSKAPAGTTHYQPNINGWQSGWIMAVEGKVFFWHEKWLIDDATLDETAIPRPAQTQWRGPEDGLPPVGTACEAFRHGEWVKCTIVVHVQSDGVTEAIYQCASDWDWSSTSFRPLKSDKERAVEAAMRASGHEQVGGFWTGSLDVYHAFGKAYDAGLLRLPEGRS